MRVQTPRRLFTVDQFHRMGEAASAEIDRTVKVPLYARAGVREVWIIDLDSNQIDMYRGQASGSYLEHETVVHAGLLRPGGLPEFEVSVDTVLG
jgi:Uma2 family endonuclease